jgi:hypothetical protein
MEPIEDCAETPEEVRYYFGNFVANATLDDTVAGVIGAQSHDVKSGI